MIRPLSAKLGVGCLILVALSVPGCDRKTPLGPDENDQPTIAGRGSQAGSMVAVTSAHVAEMLAEGGDLCLLVPTAVTLVIVKNTRLICDLQCTTTETPCIQFGAPGIKLDLNGHRVGGPADPPQNCLTTTQFLPGDGIANFVHSDVVIEGPGLVERFRRHGIALFGVRKATVKRVVSHQNCFSGVWLVGVTESLVEEVVSVRNGSASETFPCGGVCITNSNNNHVRRSEIAGNGSLAGGANDFGVGLVGTSSGNIIEENGIGGNINGVLVMPNAFGNLIRKNVIAGNPPIQVGSPPVGFDIRNLAGMANRFEENLCVTSFPAGNPCPSLPQFAGHQNN